MTGTADSQECNEWATSFFRTPMKDQVAEFATFPLEKQYKVFICGNQVVHPPAIYLAEPFARGGRATVDLLKLKLAKASDDVTINDITVVFAEIASQRTYHVARDVELMRTIRTKIDGMKNERWKRISTERLNRITSFAR